MFTNQLPDDVDYRVIFSDYAKRHYIKGFEKKYPGKQWLVTRQSIFEQLKRVHALQGGQQVDELKSGNDYILFKYDFAVAQTRISPKASGNRCVVFLDRTTQLQTVLMVYAKTDVPKNHHETEFIYAIIAGAFPKFWSRVGVN
ncbi:MAG TPA: hypothetical protein VF572_05105 [Candidatus Saccharimonadales bacterium]|jgi:hypothetical protein